MTECELCEAFWGEGGWADQMYDLLKRQNAAGRTAAEVTIDLNPLERYGYYD